MDKWSYLEMDIYNTPTSLNNVNLTESSPSSGESDKKLILPTKCRSRSTSLPATSLPAGDLEVNGQLLNSITNHNYKDYKTPTITTSTTTGKKLFSVSNLLISNPFSKITSNDKKNDDESESILLTLKDHDNNEIIRDGTELNFNFNPDPENNNDVERVNGPIIDGKKSNRRYIGILTALGSSLCFSIATMYVKILMKDHEMTESHQKISYHPFAIGVWRFQGILVPSVPIILYVQFVQKKPIFNSIWPLNEFEKRKTLFILFLRGLTGCSAVILAFVSLKYLTLADSSVIVFSTPVFVTLSAHLILGEKCEIFPLITAFMTFIGVIILARPPFLTGQKEFDTDTLIGTGFALLAMICATATFVILRYLRKMHFALVSGYFGLSSVVILTILSLSIGKFEMPQNGQDWGYAIATAFFTFIGQMLITVSFKFEQAGIVSVIRTCDVIFSFILQLFFLNVYPDIFSLIGALIVVLGVLFLAFRKWLASLKENDPIRVKLGILLK